MNVLRGHIVEAIVATALTPEWAWCAGDYAAWDFEKANGLRLEVKQSASRQSWASPNQPSACSFDIAHRAGRSDGSNWIAAPARHADIYIFAHHPICDDSADHRDPAQWDFYVVPTHALPMTKRLTLGRARGLSPTWRYSDLATAVNSLANEFKNSAERI